MKNHNLWMMIGCVLPFLLIFILPGFGISGDALLFIVILLMFGCHLFMLGRHDHRGRDQKDAEFNDSEKDKRHGCH